MPPSLTSASTTAITSGSSARKRNGGSTRVCCGATSTSSGQHSIISPATEATASTAAERRPRGTATEAGVHARSASPAATSSTAQPRRPEHLGDLRRERRRLGDHPARRARGDDLALGEHDHLVGDLAPRTPRRGVATSTACPSAASPAQDAGELRLGGVVEPAGRLVEQQHRRLDQ